jgi:hypothetical protein
METRNRKVISCVLCSVAKQGNMPLTLSPIGYCDEWHRLKYSE